MCTRGTKRTLSVPSLPFPPPLRLRSPNNRHVEFRGEGVAAMHRRAVPKRIGTVSDDASLCGILAGFHERPFLHALAAFGEIVFQHADQDGGTLRRRVLRLAPCLLHLAERVAAREHG